MLRCDVGNAPALAEALSHRKWRHQTLEASDRRDVDDRAAAALSQQLGAVLQPGVDAVEGDVVATGAGVGVGVVVVDVVVVVELVVIV